MDKKIDWTTTLVSLTLFIMMCILYIGAILYSAERLGSATQIKEILFWGFMTIFIVTKLGNDILIDNPIKYKDTQNRDKASLEDKQ